MRKLQINRHSSDFFDDNDFEKEEKAYYWCPLKISELI